MVHTHVTQCKSSNTFYVMKFIRGDWSPPALSVRSGLQTTVQNVGLHQAQALSATM